MNLDDLEHQVLGHARREMAPTPDDAGRARRALAATLGAAALGKAATASATGGWWASLGSIKTALILAIAIGGGGVALGLSVGTNRAPGSVAPAKPTQPVPAPRSAPDALPTATAEERASTLATAARDDPSLRRSASAPPAANREARNRLAEEVRLLKRADQALRQGSPQIARDLLDELSRSFPNGQLLEERAATETLLSCQRQRDARAQAAARRFLSAHPESVYAARIRAACIDIVDDDDE